MDSADLTPLHAPGSESVTDINFADCSDARFTRTDLFDDQRSPQSCAFTASIENALMRHLVQQAFSGQAT